MRIWLQKFKQLITFLKNLKNIHKKPVSTNTCTHYNCIS